MTNIELIQAIKAEIERRMKELDEQIVDIYDSKAVLRKDELQKHLSFLDTLESEKPTPTEGLEEEIARFFGANPIQHITDWPLLKNTALHFAQWGAEHARE